MQCTQSLHRLLDNLLVHTLCTQGLHRLQWAICWYSHCANRAYIGCMGDLLVPTLCTQNLNRLHVQFVGTHIVHIGPTQVAWAICWYPHCAHRAYIGCMGNLLVPTLCTQGLHRLHGQFVGIHIVHIGPTQVACAICWYPHCAHRAYIGCMDNLLVFTLCTQSLHRLHGQFVGTHIVHIGPNIGCMGNFLVPTLVNLGPTQVVWAICWYSHCANRAYIGLLGQFVGTHIVHIGAYIGCMGNLLEPTLALCAQCGYQQIDHANIGPTLVAWAICWYTHCEHRAYIGCMVNLLVPTLALCAQCEYQQIAHFNLCSPYVHNVGTNKFPCNLCSPLCSQCVYQQIAHATYVGPMCTMWVPTNCPSKLCRPYVHNVSTNKLPKQPMQALCAQCEYQQIAPCNLCRPYVHNVCTNKLSKQPMQALCAQCGFQQIAHATYVGPMCTM